MRKPPYIWLLSVAIVAGVVLVAALSRSHPSQHQRHIPPSATTSLPTVPLGSPTPTAWAFANQYVRYLDGEAKTSALPSATAAVRRIAAQAGPIPARSRSGPLRVTNLQPVADQQAAFTLVARDRRHTVVAQFGLDQTAGRWQVSRLVPPDLAVQLAPIRAPTRGVNTQLLSAPAPPAGARSAATTFLRSYLLYTYGRIPASSLKSVTPELRRGLAAEPPRVPAGVRLLAPSVRSLTLERPDGRRWTAIATVADGQHSYFIAVDMVAIGGEWAARSVRPA